MNPLSRRELIRRLRRLGFEGPFSGGRHSFMRRYAINPAHTETVLSWRPGVNFTAGLADLIAWYLANLRRWGVQQ